MKILKNIWLARVVCFGGAFGFLVLGLFILQQDELIKCVSTKHSGVLCEAYSGTRLIAWGISSMLLGGVPLGLYWINTNPRRAHVLMGIGFLSMVSFIVAPFFGSTH